MLGQFLLLGVKLVLKTILLFGFTGLTLVVSKLFRFPYYIFGVIFELYGLIFYVPYTCCCV